MFHNLNCDYEIHYFIKELGKNFSKYDLGVIAENKEKYASFSDKIEACLSDQ